MAGAKSIATVLAVLWFMTARYGVAFAGTLQGGTLQGVWLTESGEAGIELFACPRPLCGRIVWLKTPRDGAGRPKLDRKNPKAALRQRPLCGLTVLEGLQPIDGAPGSWDTGSFYDPQNGRTYKFTLKSQSAEVLVGRAYLLIPFFGETQVLRRVGALPADGWCPGLP